MSAMKEEKKKRYELIQKSIFVVYCLLCGGTMIVFSILGFKAERVSLGILFLLTSVFHIAQFHHYNNKKVAGSIYFALSLVGITLGLISLIGSQIELWVVCLMFGIMDVVSGGLEIFTNAVVLKKPFKSRSNCTEYIVSTVDIIFGILLLIKLEEGLLVHIIYLSVIFIVNAAVALTEIASKVGRDE